MKASLFGFQAILGILAALPTASWAQSTSCYNYVVAQDGSGNFLDVQSAFNAVPANSSTRTVIYVKNGTYQQAPLTLASNKINVTLIGQSNTGTVISYNNYNGKIDPGSGITFGTGNSASFFMNAAGFYAVNIAFQNSAGPVGQALAINIAGDKAVFNNCHFLGRQDTVYADRCRQYFLNCYIEGTTDFVFGPSTAVFQNCQLHSYGGTALTAASTENYVTYGYVFQNCTVTAQSTSIKTDLGRPWRQYAAVSFQNCNLGSVINPGGYDDWNNTANDATARFSEYNNTSTSAVNRVPYDTILTAAQAAAYTTLNVLKTTYANPPGTDNWDPSVVINNTAVTCGLTATPTRTFTASPTRTPTATATRSFTLTATRTYSMTPTSSPTSTPTHTPTLTRTNTRTATPTNTAAATLTATPSVTASSTPTASFTRSWTPSPTATPSASPTNTAANTPTPTSTNTRTNTPTLTPANTATSTPANTPTNTAMNTSTVTTTNTPTLTRTNTPASTATQTQTNTPTNTPTLTRTSTRTMTPTLTPNNTATSTASLTATPSASPTDTSTATATASTTVTPTSSPTLTASSTSSPTATQTATSTPTPSFTPTNSLTSTPSSTPTATASSTPVSTATASETPTASNTTTVTSIKTATATLSATPSSTPTASSTPSSTPSANQTATPTMTFTPPAGTATAVVFPNPATGPGPVTVQFTLAMPVDSLEIQLFTPVFRLVNEITPGTVSQGTHDIAIPLTDRWGKPLANGLYYLVVRSPKGRWIVRLLVLR